MHEFGIYEGLVGFFSLAVLLAILWFKKQNPWYLLAFSLFWLYLMMLVDVVIFPIPILREFQIIPGQQLGWRYVLQQVNLIPFNYVIQNNASPGAILNEILSNLLITLPFGFGLNFLVHIQERKVIWLAFLTGLGLETAQLCVSLFVGAYRTVDVTDVILNAFGFLLGYILFRLFAWLYQHGLNEFVEDVVRHA
jgi:glycopeptide antibiotics resistance protein